MTTNTQARGARRALKARLRRTGGGPIRRPVPIPAATWIQMLPLPKTAKPVDQFHIQGTHWNNPFGRRS